MSLKMPTREEQEEKAAFWKDKIVGKTLVDDKTNEEQTSEMTDEQEEPDKEEQQPDAEKEEDKVLLSSLPSPVRVIRPGSRVTRDLRPHRMNVMCDSEGLISDVRFF
ncbi:hypothetical protein GGI23_000045 [Coemansia sp. RSA 2559]|nr:hypothetical protein GGI23_000045 [Coemansia sp. RSA 2559]KAJ2869802.1 hypothetical protein GGI22_000044 [Coemansia erecta]